MVSASLVQPFLRLFDAPTTALLAKRAEPLMAGTGLTVPEITPETWIPHRVMVGMLELAVQETGDQALGIRAAEGAHDRDFGIAGLLGFVCTTLGESIHATIRYCALVHDGLEMDLVLENGQARLRMRFAGPICRAGNDFMLASLLARARRYTRLHLSPLRVRLTHPEPIDTSEYERFFRAPLEFDCERNEMLMPAAALDFPLPASDPEAFPSVLRRAEELLLELRDSRPFVQRVREVIHREMALAGPGLKQVADKLGTSARTLRRRLKEEGTTHRALVEEERVQLARAYLANPEVTLTEVAFLLGFSEEPTFHRAFRRWFGITPADYRRRLKERPAPGHDGAP